MAKCDICGKTVPKERGALLKHKWQKHHSEMETLTQKALEASIVSKQAAKASKQAANRQADESGPQVKLGGKAGKGSTETKPPGIPLTARTLLAIDIGTDKITILPSDLFRAYEEYMDMKDQLQWPADFSSTMREGMKLLRAFMAAADSVGGDNGRDRTDRRSERSDGENQEADTILLSLSERES